MIATIGKISPQPNGLSNVEMIFKSDDGHIIYQRYEPMLASDADFQTIANGWVSMVQAQLDAMTIAKADAELQASVDQKMSDYITTLTDSDLKTKVKFNDTELAKFKDLSDVKVKGPKNQ